MGPPPDTFHCMIGGTPTRPGHVKPTRHGLEVTAQGGEPVLVSWESLHVTLGGDAGDYVYLRSDAVTVWTNAEGLVAALERVGSPRLNEELAVLARGRVRRRSRARWAVGLFFAAIAGALLFLVSVPWIFMSSVGVLPRSIDRTLGDAAAGNLDAELGAPITSPLLTACIDAPVRELIAAAEDGADYEFRIEVRESEEVNAFALPGGHVVVLTGLLTASDDQEEVMGVLAHELAHVTHRDGLRAVARNAGFAIALQMLLGDDGGALIGLAGSVATLATDNAYSRDAESAADAEGARTMARAGFDPLGMARFFERLSTIEGTEMPHALAWLSTHPEHRDRVSAVRALAPSLTRGTRAPSACDWDALKAEVGE